MQRDGFGPEYINERNARIRAVTSADVARVAKRLLRKDDLTIVLVGKPDGIKADILLDKAPGMKDPEKK